MTRFTIAANNAQVGGGEVMLLAIAQALQDLGHDVHVVAPAAQEGVGREATRRGLATTAITGHGRRAYMANLRRWDTSEREGVLWCNGHVPALATAGHPLRVVHLHQAPSRVHVLAGRLAGAGALATLVPSRSMAQGLLGAQIVPNWNAPVQAVPRPAPAPGDPVTLGFLGRPSPDKGVLVLAQALGLLDDAEPGRYRLLLAGEPRFVAPEEQERVEAALAPVAHLVERPGWMERSEFFSSVDLAVFPSVWAEPFGLMVSEAMSAQVPFVVSDAGALPEVAGPAHPWVVPAGDPVALAATVHAAVTAPETQRRDALEAARARWQERFSPAAGTARLRSLLTDILPRCTQALA